MSSKFTFLVLFSIIFLCFISVSYGYQEENKLPHLSDIYSRSEMVKRDGSSGGSASESSTSGSDEEDKKTCFSGGNYYAPEENDLLEGRACCWYSESTCCTSNMPHLDLLLNYTEAAVEFWSTKWNETNDCYLNLADLVCSFCAPDTTFISQTKQKKKTVTTTTYCKEYCYSFYDNCYPHFQDFGFPNSTEKAAFCKFVWGGPESEEIKIADDATCYNGAGKSLGALSCEGCLPRTEPCSNGGWKIFLIILLVAAVVLAIAGVVFYRWKKNRQQVTFQGSNRFSEFADD